MAEATLLPDVAHARRATAAWCARINRLPAGERGARQWRCVAVNALAFRDWQCNGGRLAELLEHGTRTALPLPG